MKSKIIDKIKLVKCPIGWYQIPYVVVEIKTKTGQFTLNLN